MNFLLILSVGVQLLLGGDFVLHALNERISYCDDESAPQYIRDPHERLRVCGRSSAYR